MHPVLFEFGSFTVYTYGFCIAIGVLLGFSYLLWQSKVQFGRSIDQSNTLFLLLVTAGVLGGKLFTFFESPSFYVAHPTELLSRSGFVFYGSLLACIPVMLWYFKKNNLPPWSMLDIISVTTCLVHFPGRIGCLMAGCCYGKPVENSWGITFTNPACQASPLNTSLHPTQLYEAALILSILIFLLVLKERKQFDGQLFLSYLVLYAMGRSVIEIFRGDLQRGFVIDNILSNSQLISTLVAAGAVYFYVKRRNLNLHNKTNPPWKTKASDKK